MTTEAGIREALTSVMDPELGHNIVELGMLREVRLTGNRVDVTLALTTMGCPLRERMINDIKRVIGAIDPALQTNVQVVAMTEAERARVFESARQPRPGAAEGANRIGNVVAVLSGKGGVGKSSVAALLAVALRRQGQRVGVLDADITGPSIPRMFGVSGMPQAGPHGIIPLRTSTGIAIMSINLLLPSEDEAVIWRGPLISGAIRQFWTDVHWDELDTLVVDLPPGTSDPTLTVMQAMPVSGVVLVTTPQDLAGMVVRKAARMMTQMSVPILGLVENMSYVRCPDCEHEIQVFGPSQAEETAKRMGVPLLGRLPLDPQLAELADTGRIESYPAEAFGLIAAAVMERMPATTCRPQAA